MAVGKSAVGRALARLLKRPFVDLDSVVEKTEGLKIKDIFEQKGESYFRQCEKKALAEILERENQIIATGGGAILDKDNLRLLREKSLLIALTASTQVIMKRVGIGAERPLMKGSNRQERVTELLKMREKAYARAHLSVDTTHLTIRQVAETIIKMANVEN